MAKLQRQVLAQSLGHTITDLPDHEKEYMEGEYGELQIYTSDSLAPYQIQQLEDDIRARGVVLSGPITHDARTVFIPFQKAQIPLALIASAVAALIVIVPTSIVGWQLYKTFTGVPKWIYLGLGGLAIYFLWKDLPWRKKEVISG